jgi:hypothetical protein
MVSQLRRPTNHYELLPRDSFDEEAKDFPETLRRSSTSTSWLSRLASKLRTHKFPDRAAYALYVTPRRRKRSVLRLVYWSIFSVPYLVVFLVLFVSIFFPSYTVRPAHYSDLRNRALATTHPGRANPHSEKVFIAAALYEEKGQLTSGAWGRAVLRLVDLLGPDNVHLSIYEDNPDLKTKQSLIDLRGKVTCEPYPTCEGCSANNYKPTPLSSSRISTSAPFPTPPYRTERSVSSASPS